MLILDGSTLPTNNLVGSKARNLSQMVALGLPVPPAFAITTQAWQKYFSTGRFSSQLVSVVDEGIDYIELKTGRGFGGVDSPLLVSVRSGSPVSMPGMMDTMLNVGMNDETEIALAAENGNGSFARETHRCFCEMYARIVLRSLPIKLDPKGEPPAWRATIKELCNDVVPNSPREQLYGAVRSVFDSWNSARAKRYRQHYDISEQMGTAVIIQAMVFGNADANSGTGVVFSRNPLTGDHGCFGEYLVQAQGEDVVSGSHTPNPLSRLQEIVPTAHAQLLSAAARLEQEHRAVQDIEFTVERGQLFFLQSRSARCSADAEVRIAVDFVREGMLTEDQALKRISVEQVRKLLRPRLAAKVNTKRLEPLIVGEAASPGTSIGVVMLDTDSARTLVTQGKSVILARPTTSPLDLQAMLGVAAVITERGGSTSHAAVICRQLVIPCVVGCGEGALTGLSGLEVTVDGTSGRIYSGALPLEQPNESDNPNLAQLSLWAKSRSPIGVDSLETPIPFDALDLDGIAGGDDIEQTLHLLKGVRAAMGSVLNTEAGVRAAIAAGVQNIFVRQVLPTLLVACTLGPEN